MIYQRHIPPQELIAAQLEMLLQNGRRATISMHLVGLIAAVVMFWPFMSLTNLLLWAAAFLILLLTRSLQMSNALVERRYQTHPKRVYWQLLIGAALTGSVWSGVYIFAAQHVPVTIQYVLLLLIVMITAFLLGFSVDGARVFHRLCVYLAVAHGLVESGSLLGATVQPADWAGIVGFLCAVDLRL